MARSMRASVDLTRRTLAAAGLAALAAPTAACVTASRRSTGSPLWLIEQQGGRVYLFGFTFRYRQADWSEPEIERIAAACEVIWTEIGASTRGDVRDDIRRYGIETGSPLSERLSREDWTRVQAACALVNIASADLAQFRPWWAAQTLLQASFAARAPIGRVADAVIADQARNAGKRIESEFPTQNDALAWFGGLTSTQDTQYLRYTVDQILEPSQSVVAESEAWLRGETGPIDALVSRWKADYPDIYAMLETARQLGWARRIRAMLAERKPAFVVIGLNHLAGPDSVQIQLAASGLRARRIA